MSDLLRIAMAQINSSVGDFEGNKRKIIDCIDQAKSIKADIIAFPELAITGYPPQDLLFNTKFIETNLEVLDGIVTESNDITSIIGFVDKDQNDNICQIKVSMSYVLRLAGKMILVFTWKLNDTEPTCKS